MFYFTFYFRVSTKNSSSILNFYNRIYLYQVQTLLQIRANSSNGSKLKFSLRLYVLESLHVTKSNPANIPSSMKWLNKPEFQQKLTKIDQKFIKIHLKMIQKCSNVCILILILSNFTLFHAETTSKWISQFLLNSLPQP